MKVAGAALAIASIFGAQSAAAADSVGMMKTINGFVAASLAGKRVDGFLTPSPSMIDEVPPYHWSGPGATKQWLADVGGWAKANGATHLKVRLGVPTRTDQTGTQGYVVTPATFTYSQKGRTEREEAAMVFTLNHTRSGWRISSFAWTGAAIKP